MPWQPITKSLAGLRRSPNLANYESACKEFSWEKARSRLGGLPAGRGVNIAHEAVDRHATGGRAEQVAFRCIAKNGEVRDLTFQCLRDETNRFANVLANLGVGQGDRVFVLAGRIPELYIAVLGALKHRCVVFGALFPRLGLSRFARRLEIGEPGVLVTTPTQYPNAKSLPFARGCRFCDTCCWSAKRAPPGGSRRGTPGLPS